MYSKMHVFIQSKLNFHTKKIVRSDFIIFSDMVLNVYETKWDYVQFFSALNFKLREHFFLHVALLELFCYDIVMFQEGCEAIVLFNIHGEFYYIVMSIDDLKTGIFLVCAKVLWFLCAVFQTTCCLLFCCCLSPFSECELNYFLLVWEMCHSENGELSRNADSFIEFCELFVFGMRNECM